MVLPGKGPGLLQMRRILLLAVEDIPLAEHTRKLQPGRVFPEFLLCKGRYLLPDRFCLQDRQDPLPLGRYRKNREGMK